MWNFIQKLREKPEHTRRQIGFLTSVVLTAIIFLVWLSINISSPSNEYSLGEGEVKVSPFASVKDAFSITSASIKESLSEAKASIFSGMEVYQEK